VLHERSTGCPSNLEHRLRPGECATAAAGEIVEIVESESQIRELVARIEAYRKQRDGEHPAPDRVRAADLAPVDGFRCHPDGSISYLRRPIVEVELSPEFSQLEPDYEAPVELIHIAADGTITNRAIGNLRMV